ncbi:adenosylcobinamide-GDP ribazoletransferase [Devosia albogilva]|uniref:Adenosylcobinamide-GDP ribazoletransferase n=1 Tax=Devosia albogilva TaxID=429726 RepID=A0ABW5QMT3_9HYPH
MQPKPDIDTTTAPDRDERADTAVSGQLGLGTDLVMALRFFSRLPTGDSPHQVPDMNRMAMALPLASLIIGAGPALLLALGAAIGWPPLFAATLAVALMVIVGGGMTEDALADSADGLFGGNTAERRLEIMKDSRHGTYGVSALALLLIARVTGLAALVAAHPILGGLALLALGVACRSASLALPMLLPPARSTGASSAAGRLKPTGFWIGAAMAGVLVFMLAGPVAGVVGVVAAVIAAALVVAGWMQLCRSKVGGQTGDLIGGLGALVEVAVLAVMLAFA